LSDLELPADPLLRAEVLADVGRSVRGNARGTEERGQVVGRQAAKLCRHLSRGQKRALLLFSARWRGGVRAFRS